MIIISFGIATISYSRGVGAIETVGGTLCNTRVESILVLFNKIGNSRDAAIFQSQDEISFAEDVFVNDLLALPEVP